MSDAFRILIVVAAAMVASTVASDYGTVLPNHDYGDVLSKSILFFEGQRSGKLPPNQRLTWRKDSALHDGSDVGVDLTGGYYDAGDNVKYNFPMAFTTTLLAWSVIEYGKSMGPELQHALEAIRWSTDFLLKSTNNPDVIYVQVGDANDDHNCWERPEDMDTLRTSVAINKTSPGSEVSAEIAAALAASSIAFRLTDRVYSALLLKRAISVFDFANTYQGSYNDGVGKYVCPYYCDYGGTTKNGDELLWGAAWLYKATKSSFYSDYVIKNIKDFEGTWVIEFGWDAKHAGINVLLSSSKDMLNYDATPYADQFVCSLLPESPDKTASYSDGGLLFKPGGGNLQHTTSLSFLLLTYGRYMSYSNREVTCGAIKVNSSRLIHLVKSQVDYILGTNPMNMSYMVGYGEKFPQRIHHRGSSLPSIYQHPEMIKCKEGTPYYQTNDSNPNLLIGALVGGPDTNDFFADDRTDPGHSEPITYINAPFVGILAFFRNRAMKYL